MSLSGEAVLYVSSPSDQTAQNNARRERRRRKIVKEFFDTEKTYLHHLEIISKYFDFPLRFDCIVPEDVHTRLFSNLEQIYDVNVTLLDQMEQSTIGQAFSQLGPFLKLYSTYANNHQFALRTLQEWQSKSSAFTDFLSRQESMPEVKGLKLNALLIMPVQRIPRYKLLLEDLLESTLDDHHDYDNLKEAAEKIGDIALHINEHIRQNENFMKMLAIQRSFYNSAPNLLVPGRQFIKEGLLKKVSRKGGKSFERMFFLFSDILLYGKSKFLDGGGRSYSCSCVLPLKHCKVEPVFITSLKKCDTGGAFKISCKEESFVLFSDDQECAKEWVNELDRAIRKLCDDRQTLRRPSSNKIPLRGRSLRQHRHELKKNENKILDKTPQRPLSQISVNSDSDCSPNIKARLAPVRRHFRQIYTNNMTNCQTDKEANMSQLDLCSNSPVIRRKKKYMESASTDSTSATDDISLSDTDTGTISTSELVANKNSRIFGGVDSGDETMSQGEMSCEDDTDDNRQSIRQYSFSLRGSRGLFHEENMEYDSICMDDEDSTYKPPQRPMSMVLEEDQRTLTKVSPKTLASSRLSSPGPFFPSNSPAHKYLNKRTLNMRLRSYLQKPLKRFQQAKKELSNPCSPFRSKAVVNDDRPRRMKKRL